MAGFTIRCDECSSEDIVFTVNPGEFHHEVYIVCNECANSRVEYC